MGETELFESLKKKFGKFLINKTEASKFMGVGVKRFNELVKSGALPLNVPHDNKKGQKTYFSISDFASALAKLGEKKKQ